MDENSVDENESMDDPGLKPVESDTAKPAEPILIDQFEGEYVRDFEGKLSSINMVMPEGYARGTHLKLMVEVRVRNVRYEEAKNKELSRQHIFALENIELVGAYTPDQLDPGVGGNAAASVVDDTEPDEQPEQESPEQEECGIAHPTQQFFCDQPAGHPGLHLNSQVVGALW